MSHDRAERRRISDVLQARVPWPIVGLVIVATSGVAAVVVGRHHQWYRHYRTCLSQRRQIAVAELAYRKTHLRFLTGGGDAISGLVAAGLLSVAPRCPLGGRYTVGQRGDTVMVHCSLPEHDSSPDGSRGVQRKSTPSASK